MRRALHNANADLAKQHPNYVVRIVSDEGEVGTGHLSDFADTESEMPVIATTSQLLSTGVDLPTVRNIVLFRTVGSIALFKQMIGRGTRLFPDQDKLRSTSSTTPTPQRSSPIRSSTALRSGSTRRTSTRTARSWRRSR